MTGCRVIGLRCPLHHHKARLRQVFNQPLRSDAGHHAVSVVDPLPTVVAECKRQRLGEFIGRCWAKGRGVRHGGTLSRPLEQNKNECTSPNAG